MSKDIFDLTAPFVVKGIKFTTKISKKIVRYLKKKHQKYKKKKDIYVNPLRIAARLYAKSRKIERLDESLFK